MWRSSRATWGYTTRSPPISAVRMPRSQSSVSVETEVFVISVPKRHYRRLRVIIAPMISSGTPLNGNNRRSTENRRRDRVIAFLVDNGQPRCNLNLLIADNWEGICIAIAIEEWQRFLAVPLAVAYRRTTVRRFHRRAAHLPSCSSEGPFCQWTEEWSSDDLLCSRSRERAATRTHNHGPN
jgi:hypothetical protein